MTTLDQNVREQIRRKAVRAADQVTLGDRSKGSGWRQVFNAERRVLVEEYASR